MAVQRCCRGATSSGFFRLRAKLCRSATSTVVSSAMREAKDLREVSAYSTDQSDLGLGAAGSRRQRGKVNGLRWTIRQMPRRFRKACNLPVSPRLLAASCHPACVQNRRVRYRPFGRYTSSLSPSKLSPARGWPSPRSVECLFSLVDETSPEKFRHNTHRPRIATSWNPPIAWKAPPTRTPPPICTSAPVLKPRWSQDRGRCGHLRNTPCVAARNAFDSAPARPTDVQLAPRHRELRQS